MALPKWKVQLRMPVSLQTAIVILAVGGAAFYLARSLLKRTRTRAGCKSCPANRNRNDDYA